MGFLNPFLLFGIGAIGVPIVIHLLTKRKIRRVVWAAMQFLAPVVQRNQRRLNLEDILLLLLRCLLLALLAIALARPAWRRSGVVFGGRGAETAVIAIDNSYSMSANDGVTSRFEMAKKAAEQIVDALPAGSAAAVLFCSDVVQPAIPEPTFDLNLARKAIRDGALSDHATDYTPSFRDALNILNRHAAPRKSIYLVTDNQATGWKRLADIRAMIDAAKLEVKSRIVIVGEQENRNLGVSNLRMAGALAPVNQSVRFEVEVTNFGRDDARDVQVSLLIDGEPPCDDAAIDGISAGSAKTVSLFARFREPGSHVLTAKIAGDHLPADDRRTIVVRALKEIHVLLVDGDPGAEPREGETFFLSHALTPVPPSEKESYFLKTTTIAPSELETAKLGDYDAVVLANVARCSDAALTSMDRYLRRGGGLIIFPGGKINVDFYNEKMGGESGFLPAIIGTPHGDEAEQEKFFTLQEKGYEHPIVSPWKDPAAGTLATAHFYRAFTLKPGKAASKDGGEPQIVLSYADDTPAVMERTWGFGRVILFSSSAGTKWNDLPVRPVFVPLIYRALGSILNRGDERLNVRVGAPFEHVCDADLIGKDAAITKPGATKEAAVLRRVKSENGLPILRFDETDVAGIYDLNLGGDTPQTIKFATQSDPRESSLETLRQSDLDSLAPAASAIRWNANMNFAETLEKERTGNEFWFAFMLCALALACAETVLADRFSYAK